eukprot:GGOE01037357.1.p1 GENE.GGOE01037357.1~~GGOE01037357.1.p1  ORF type:complete len:853 (-),score=128.31 GGOE01037357.1:115-2397(-)
MSASALARKPELDSLQVAFGPPANRLSDAEAAAQLQAAHHKSNTPDFRAWELETAANADGLEDGCKVDDPQWRSVSTCGVHHIHREYIEEAHMQPHGGSRCSHIVVASVNLGAPRPLAVRPPHGWCCILAEDSNQAWTDPVAGQCQVLSRRHALGLGYAVSKLWPKLGIDALRMVAFLEAIRMGAEVVAEVSIKFLRSNNPIAVLPETNQMVGEWDATDLVVDPYTHFDTTDLCVPHQSSRGPPEADPYFIHNDGGGVRYLSVQQPVHTPAWSPESACLCRVSWNLYHSKCRKRYKKCSVASLNFPISPRMGTWAHTTFGPPLTVFHRRAFWALFQLPSGGLLRSALVQLLLWQVSAAIVLYNASNYLPGALEELRSTDSETRCRHWKSINGSQPLYRSLAALQTSPGSLLSRLRNAIKTTGTVLDIEVVEAWLWDLAKVGYAEPQPPQIPGHLAAAVVMLDESARDVMRNVWYWNHLRFLRRWGYPLWLFYIAGTLTEKDRSIILERLPGFVVRLFPIQYFLPRRFWADHWTWTRNGTKGYGYLYCSQFLGYEMFKHPMFKTIRFYFRFDEDTHPFVFPNGSVAALISDPFHRMQHEGLRFITPQGGVQSLEWDNSLSDATETYLAAGKLSNVSSMWHLAQSHYPRYGRRAWDRFVYAGCAELAEVDVYRNKKYFEFLWNLDWLRGVYLQGWLEQAFKTIWPLLTVPPPQWDYSCETVLQHKSHPTGPFCHELSRSFPLRLLKGGRPPKPERFLSAWQK